jgi:hypothetical protein
MSSPVKGLCDRCLLKFIDWRYSQSFWYFPPSFLNYWPSILLFGSPPPPSLCQIQTVCGWEGVGGGVLSCVGDHIMQEFNTLNLTRFRTYKIAAPPPKKTYIGGLRQINTCHKVPLQFNFFRWRHFSLFSISLIFLCNVMKPSSGWLYSMQWGGGWGGWGVSRSQMFPHKSQGKNFFSLFRGDEFYKIHTLRSNLCIPGMELHDNARPQS